MRLLMILLLGALVLPSLRAAAPADASETTVAGGYMLRVEDLLTVTVYGHDELARDVVVLPDGGFDYPIVGKVEAAGKTTDAVASAIAGGLKREFAAPRVTVSVKQPAVRRVYASGLVGKAGSYDLKPGWRVSHLIAEAGGLNGKPELLKAVVVRGDASVDVDLAAVTGGKNRAADPELRPGDLLQVLSDTSLVHIVGQVKTPGDYQVKSRLGVLEAVAMAGGVTERAALTRAQIVRGGEVVKVDLHALLVQGRTEGNRELLPGDTLVVPANEARIAVLGAVGQPGYYDLPDGKAVTVADALGLAKGPRERARIGEVALVRDVRGEQVVSRLDMKRFLQGGDLSQNPPVQPGDVIYVAEGKERITLAQVFGAMVSIANPLVYSLTR